MAFFKEFKEFAMKGNVIDLAVGVVIGGAFQGIVNSLVKDIIMPLTAIFTGNVDYSTWVISLAGGNVQIGIGSFLNAVINFLIIALSIFIALNLSLIFKLLYIKVSTKKEPIKPVAPVIKIVLSLK